MTILEQARAVAGTGPVCATCLGRPFAERSFGLTNAERGRALRTTIALEDDEPHEPVSPVDCWVCEGYCAPEVADALAEAVVAALEGFSVGSYQVGTRTPPLVEENDRLLREDAGLPADAGDALNRDRNREVGRRVGTRLEGADVDFDRPDALAVIDLEAFDPREVIETGTVTGHAVDVQVNPAFVYGRYRKREREIPQTEWPCRECGGSGVQLGDDGEEPCDHCGGSGYMYDTSVEQVVRPHVVEAMDGEAGTFHGAGREDVDARMLGEGRPFVLEVERPRNRSPELAPVETAINESEVGVEVSGLRLASYETVERVKEHAASKRYRAEVAFGEPVEEGELEGALAELRGTTVAQETPQRVDHRRASMVRERTVYDAGGDLEEPTRADVEIHGEGGLYVKELISGDDDRTEPSLAGLLGTDAEVTALDVLAVEGEDEPFEREEFFLDDGE
ncbi:MULTISPECIES: tRNA pseudouridine(54/55) synthase Pus10 [Saliphagus]|uniref:tRNA pseudouridine synthase Pus10 n=1 Tax=Saliphagus infecundisoli TaxID=1849069 RepID=A0ABD5QI55_9EURY|nr:MULTISPECIES: tRNA pseudouridine(54/55) synthase Pus10 [Saliphagus]